MNELVALCEELGFTHVQSYLQSGNLVLDAGRADPGTVVTKLRKAIEESFGYTDVDVLLRDAGQLTGIIADNPFLVEGADPKTLHVTLLGTAVKPALKDDGSYAPDAFRSAGQNVYVSCPDGYGRTKLNNQFFEKKLGARATTRNWRTITSLGGLVFS
ncbi:MAG: DUF1697 domain-containing protein [Actinomycetota bacterium]|nr:DUF1697 domain-containing protein [Actinomycetota bacterium]